MPKIMAMAIMKMQEISAAIIGHSARCRICIVCESRFSPNTAVARSFAAAVPAETPDATKSAGSTAVLMSG